MSKKEDKLKEISVLQKKRASVGLTPDEEKIYCKLNSEVSGYPEIMFTKEYNDKLDEVISTTEKLLSKWLKK